MADGLQVQAVIPVREQQCTAISSCVQKKLMCMLHRDVPGMKPNLSCTSESISVK